MDHKEFKASLDRLSSLKDKLNKKEDAFLEWVFVRYAEDPNTSINSIVTDFFNHNKYEEDDTLNVRKSQ